MQSAFVAGFQQESVARRESRRIATAMAAVGSSRVGLGSLVWADLGQGYRQGLFRRLSHTEGHSKARAEVGVEAGQGSDDRGKSSCSPTLAAQRECCGSDFRRGKKVKFEGARVCRAQQETRCNAAQGKRSVNR